MTYIPNKYGFVSTNNSTTSTLTANSTFTGTSEEVKDYTIIKVSIVSNASSASNGVSFEFSSDNTNWDIVKKETYSLIDNKTFYRELEIKAKYFRIIYKNGTTNQTSFRLQTVYNTQIKHEEKEMKSNNLIDGFGRLRISNPSTLLSIHHVRGKNVNDVSEIVISGATSVHSTQFSAITMSTTTVGDQVIRQSRKRGIYQPGKNMLAFLTGKFGTLTNTVAKIGLYDATSGIYFKNTNNVISLCIVSGTGSTNEISRDNWNENKVDGSENITVDFTKTLIYFIEYQWLGVGTVSFGCIIDEKRIYFHKEKHSGVSSLNGAYMKTGSLPIRYEIEQTGTGSGTLYMVCGCIMSEGGYNLIGRQHSVNNDTTAISVGTTTKVPIISLKLKTGGENSKCVVLFKDLMALCTTTGNVLVEVYKFNDLIPSSFLTNSSFVSAESDSAVEYDVSATAITLTNGNRIASGYITNNSDFIDLSLSKENVFLTTNWQALSDVISIVAKSIGQTESILTSVTFDEFI